jgi:HD-GYP domain-containing protein (c-di-GMP phosphodiesterase class II)
VAALVTLVACAASVVLYATAKGFITSAAHRPDELVALAILTLFLQFVLVEGYRSGSISIAGVGLLAIGFACGIGAAMIAGLLSAAVHAIRRRPKPYKVIFNMAVFGLAAAAGTGVFELINRGSHDDLRQVGGAVAAGAAFTVVNLGLLTLAMAFAEHASPFSIFRERLQWLAVHNIAFGPLALGAVTAYERIGLAGIAAFALPPALMTLSVHQYLNRTRQSVDDVREANRRLQTANADLEERNRDLADVLSFSTVLAAHAHDRDALARTSEQELAQLLGGVVRVRLTPDGPGEPLLAGRNCVGRIDLSEARSVDIDRWGRLSAILLPHLATSVESANLVDELRRRHLATIAALSRSMEAKDSYTGGHVERVSEVAVALATRLGYEGEELDAIEVGALLHDIGKIGIPESIIQKPGPLDAEEWAIMKQHPLISEHILAGSDLSPIVLQIARSSHERIDGTGYPDGLAGDAIPLPARIILVADGLDALTSDRPYRRGRSVAAALAEIRAHTGTQFCERVVQALEALYHEQPDLLGAPPRLQAVGAVA